MLYLSNWSIFSYHTHRHTHIESNRFFSLNLACCTLLIMRKMLLNLSAHARHTRCVTVYDIRLGEKFPKWLHWHGALAFRSLVHSYFYEQICLFVHVCLQNVFNFPINSNWILTPNSNIFRASYWKPACSVNDTGSVEAVSFIVAI